MTDESVHCAGCGQPLTPGSLGVLTAVEIVHSQDFGGEPADVREDGRRVFFHSGCRPASRDRYRIV